MKKHYFLLALILYAMAVFYLAYTTPISPHEAKILYTSQGIVASFMKWGQSVVHGFLGLRVFSVLFGFLSIVLFYELSQRYFPKREDAYLSVFVFMLLPGILTATVLSNVAIVVLFLVLLFIFFYEKNYFIPLPFIMLALFFIHEASIIFFIGVFLYSIVHKKKKLFIASTTFLISFVYLTKGIKIGGSPAGHFVEIFGLYATVFSPFLFLYFFYAMYRILLREKKTLLWYIAFTAFAFSLILSIRQKVYITDFAPYVMIAVIPMFDIFSSSVRVRLPEFQKRYKRGFYAVMTFLLISVFLIIFHKMLFFAMKDPSKHFAKHIYRPYLLAKELKRKDISCYDNIQAREYYQLRYYGISSCSNLNGR